MARGQRKIKQCNDKTSKKQDIDQKLTTYQYIDCLV